MCGITGAIWNDPAGAIDGDTLARMIDVLAHRGPDDRGAFTSEFLRREPYEPQPGVALGHRRLAIIDVAESRQPIANEDDSVWLVFNGEIYNYPQLRQRLEGAGHRFRTHGDTETIVHLYEDEGPAACEHLNGMFAFALWDARRRRLVLARDRLGKKPLFYRLEANRLLFASELKSLLEIPGVERRVDPCALDEYLTYQYVPHPNTMLAGFRKLPPGHYAIYQDGKLTVEPYWRPAWNRETSAPGGDPVAELRRRLAAAVELRLQSEVPLGAFLSGGVDSSIIVALMQKLSGERVKTFTIGFAEGDYDERPFARRVAQHLGTDHHEFEVTPDSVAVLDQLVWHYDDPLADSSAVPTWYVAELTRRQVTVALTGDGGDELFAGYERYRAVALADRLDRLGPLRAVLAHGWWQNLPHPQRERHWLRRIKRFSSALAERPERRYLRWIGIFDEAQRAALFQDAVLEQLSSDPAEFLGRAWRRVAPRDAVSCASLADLTTYLPCDLMAKVDIASMAHGLECRQPLLDVGVVELAIGLARRHKYARGRGKRILQQAFGNLLPGEVFRRKKMGFGVPVGRWLRGDLKPLLHDTLLSPSARCREFFRPEALVLLAAEHESGQADHSYRLWALLFFELWLRRWLG